MEKKNNICLVSLKCLNMYRKIIKLHFLCVQVCVCACVGEREREMWRRVGREGEGSMEWKKEERILWTRRNCSKRIVLIPHLIFPVSRFSPGFIIFYSLSKMPGKLHTSVFPLSICCTSLDVLTNQLVDCRSILKQSNVKVIHI